MIRDLRGADARSRRSSATTAASRSSPSSSPPTSRSPRSSGCRAPTRSPRPCPLLDDQGHMTPQEVERELTVDVAVRWGTGYDTELRSFVNVIATPKGGTHVSGFEQAMTKTFNDVMRADQGAQGQRRRRDQGRRARGPDRGGHGPAGRAAVRGPDQGDPRHAGRAHRRTQGRVGGAEEVPHLHQAGREGAGQAGHGEGRRRVQDPDRRPPAQGDPAPQERPGVLGAAGQARRLPRRTTTSAPSCSSSRATRRSAPPSSPATPSSRRCCRSAARS